VSDFGERARPGENHDEPSKAAEPPTGARPVRNAPNSLPPLIWSQVQGYGSFELDEPPEADGKPDVKQLRLEAPEWLLVQSRLGTRCMVRHHALFGYTPASSPLEVCPTGRVLIQGLFEMLGTSADTDGEEER
jgi:hypothetical protein